MFLDVKPLLTNPLFKNFDEDMLRKHIDFDQCIFGNYKKGTLIVQEEDPCTAIGFVLSGILAIQQLSPTGEVLTIRLFDSNDAFGTALYSSENPKYPFTLVTLKNSQVLYISFQQIRELLHRNLIFNQNFISFLSSRVLDFKEKLQMMQHKDVRSRLMIYLSNEFKSSGTATFKLQHSKSAISDIIGVARPSVSRELKSMTMDHLIIVTGQIVTLLKPELF